MAEVVAAKQRKRTLAVRTEGKYDRHQTFIKVKRVGTSPAPPAALGNSETEGL
jgi:hypothetical protein